MPPDWTLDVTIAPDAALARVSSAINLPRKRVFGVFKTQREFVGVVGDGEFEIWERGQRAVHGIGLVRGRHGGSRVELRFRIAPRTQAMIGLFFVLYVVVAVGIAQQPPEALVSAQEAAAIIIGAAVLTVIFATGAWRQRADLRVLIENLFADTPSDRERGRG